MFKPASVTLTKKPERAARPSVSLNEARNRMKVILVVGLLLAAHSPSLRAQASEISEVERAAMAEVAKILPNGRVVLDEMPLAPGKSGTPRESKESKALAAQVRGGASVAPAKRHYPCPSATPRECRLDADALVSLSRPRISGNSATVSVQIRTVSRIPDSLTERTDYTVYLVREKGVWVVSKLQATGAT